MLVAGLVLGEPGMSAREARPVGGFGLELDGDSVSVSLPSQLQACTRRRGGATSRYTPRASERCSSVPRISMRNVPPTATSATMSRSASTTPATPRAAKRFVQAARYLIHKQAIDVVGEGLRGWGSQTFAAGSGASAPRSTSREPTSGR